MGDPWGGYDVTAWFRARVPVPSRFAGKKTVLRLLVGPRDGGGSTAETLVYLNGAPLQGIDVWHEEAWLPPEELETGEICLALKAWSGVIGVPERRRFKLAELAWVDEATETYYHLVKTLIQAVKALEETDLRRVELLQAINASILCIDWFKPRSEPFYQSVVEALRLLLEKTVAFQETAEMKPAVTGIGHAHIDMAWLWRLKDTREKAARTFSTALHLMRQYPEYVFMHSSPQLYRFLKNDHPEIYARIQEMAAAGRWEVEGGMWVEADTNLPSGESLVRQFLLGKRFVKEEFGVDMQDALAAGRIRLFCRPPPDPGAKRDPLFPDQQDQLEPVQPLPQRHLPLARDRRERGADPFCDHPGTRFEVFHLQRPAGPC